ncbi:MAG: hypothetical protein DSZ24_05460 [Thermodesulfatator sp.]|nr:MAG: hypothetical protein DSZ24_05460 [Thermodesulfatator sp.]
MLCFFCEMRFHELERRLYRRLREARVVNSRAEARTLLLAFLELLRRDLLKKKRVKLTGFGTLAILETSPRRAYDFYRRAPLELPPRLRFAFRASRRLKKALSGK